MLERAYDWPLSAASGGAAGNLAACPASNGTGAAGARRVGEKPAAAAAPLADRWAPRPKPDPLTARPEIGWEAARLVQRKRRQAANAAKRNPRQLKDGAGAFIMARSAAETAAELERQACPIEQAKLALRRRNVIVYSMSVEGGSPELFFVSTLGRDVTAAQLIAAAARLQS